MKAFIPAAGLGTRLGSLTKEKPKALVELNGKTMLEMTVDRLKNQGIEQFMVNVHHHAEKVISYLTENNNFGVDIKISDESSDLLDTGGAIKKAADFFTGNEPVLVHNVDIISYVNIHELKEYHIKKNTMVSLCVRKRESSRGLLFDHDMNLAGWTNKKTNEYKWAKENISNFQLFAFSGIYMVSPGFGNFLPAQKKFSIIDAWLKIAKYNKLVGYLDMSPYWFDLGTIDKIDLAEIHLRNQAKANIDTQNAEKR